MSVTARLDRLPLSAFHWKIVLISGLAWMFGATSLSIVFFVFPVLVDKWGLSPDDIGFIGTMQSAGMLVGSLFVGALSDRYGRKNAFQATVLVYTLCSGLSGLAGDVLSFAALRFFVGFGLGGMLPVASTIVSEFSPSRFRGLLMVGLESFWAYGSIVVALASYLIIPAFGWQVALFASGLPALYVLVLNRGLLESPRHLLSKGKDAEAEALIDSIETRYYRGHLPPTTFPGTPNGVQLAPRVSLLDLWRPPLTRRTLCLWAVNFPTVFTYFGVFVWLPTLLVKAGHGLAQSFAFLLIINLGQVPAYFVTAYLVDKIGRKWTLVPAFLLYGIAAYLFGQASGDVEIVIWGLAIAFFNAGVYGTVYTYTPELYPTWARATGTGAAVAFGRVGAILAPIVVARMLGDWSEGYTLVFIVFAAVLISGSLAVLVFGEETKGRSLEEITSERAQPGTRDANA